MDALAVEKSLVVGYGEGVEEVGAGAVVEEGGGGEAADDGVVGSYGDGDVGVVAWQEWG